ncbi:DUF721 domain-containing protein [Burkholderia sp. WAC0059]|uniref:DciA family protein n=1 Tax=Burkholderia sp. WAC0059 TaxID=2066022 RepID=UPI000C7F34B7|nr:DciA family protein [Burkholderia sp. WAC0059]PLZ01603.1 DUF721 domain-containing protein [Burkholderia sp. WAC0059]
MSRFSPFARPSPTRYATRSAQPVAEVLGRTEAFAPLRAGVEQIAAIERDLMRLLPDYMVSSVEPGFIRDGTLVLFAAHNALAARLRHLEPSLVSDLQARGWSLNALRIRVRPRSMQEPPQPKQARMTPAGAAALMALSETLTPSPLQTALAKMAARHLRKDGEGR